MTFNDLFDCLRIRRPELSFERCVSHGIASAFCKLKLLECAHFQFALCCLLEGVRKANYVKFNLLVSRGTFGLHRQLQ